jgi:D-serine dehydratase
VDSRDGVEFAAAAHRAVGARRPLRVLVELGHPGGRTGCRGKEQAADLAAQVAAASELVLCGISGFEGTISLGTTEETTREEAIAPVTAFLSELRDAYDLLATRDAFELERPLLTAGGSAYFDRVVETFGDSPAARVVLRSGCYVTHDCGSYDRLSPMGGPNGSLRSAIEVWGAVVSTPEPDLALVGIGKRDASHDAGLPHVTRWRAREREPKDAPDGLELFALNDQHAYVSDPERRLAVGDLVGCCISHPCTTFDKWRRFELVDDRYRRVDTISTYF